MLCLDSDTIGLQATQLDASRALATGLGEEAYSYKKSAWLLASLLKEEDYKCAICQHGVDGRDQYPHNRCHKCKFFAHGYCHDLSKPCPICKARVGPPPPPLADMATLASASTLLCCNPIVLE